MMIGTKLLIPSLDDVAYAADAAEAIAAPMVDNDKATATPRAVMTVGSGMMKEGTWWRYWE